MIGRKMGSGLLALSLLLSSLTLPASAAGEDITAFTLSGDAAYTTPVRSEDKARIGEMWDAVSSSVKASLPAGAGEIARLTVEQGGKSTAYSIFADGGNVFARAGSTTSQLDADLFYKAVSQVPDFYKFRPIPTAQLPGEDAPAAAVTASSYSFRKLDGVFYRTRFTSQAAKSVPAAGGTLPLPKFSTQPNSIAVTVSDGEAQLFSGTSVEAEKYAVGTKAVLVRIEAAFDNASYKGSVTYQYSVDTSGGVIAQADAGSGVRFQVEGSSTYPGELIVLRAQGVPAGETITVASDIDFKPSFHDDGQGGKIALMPVSYFVAAGSHYVQLTAGGKTERFSITANGKDFQVQHLTVSASTTEQTIASQKANEEFNNTILTLRWNDDAQQRWNGRFILPVQGARITTQFGCIRYTNGSSSSDRHGGVDMAVAAGTPVSATNSGRVLYAGYLQLTGYTILVEHGYGLKSWHYHMNSVNVKTGDLVEKGQKIGEVGSTGFSTGPHLHFAMSVNNVFINPYTLINTDLLD